MSISISLISMLAGLAVFGVLAVRAVSAARRRVAPIKIPVRVEHYRR